jgi:arylsulfatase A-like enzyme
MNMNAPSSSFFISRFDRLKRYLSGINLSRQYGAQFPRGVPNSGRLYFTIEQVVDWLQNQFDGYSSPFFGYIHLLPPHNPYNTRREFIDAFKDGWQPASKPENYFSEGVDEATLTLRRQLYDEFIAYVDAEFGRLFKLMEEKGVLDRTCLIFTSDHGEMFERGIWAHITPTLYEPIIHIPLLMWLPGISQRQDVFAPTSCVDLVPTLLQLAGKPIPTWCEGQVLPVFGDADQDSERSIYVVEAKENPMLSPLEIATIALLKGHHKLVHYLGYEQHPHDYEFYDLQDDPDELVDLYPTQMPVVREMQDELTNKLAQVNRVT